MTQQVSAAATPESGSPRKRRRLWLILALIVLFFAFAAYRSPVLRLGEALVTGTERLTSQRVVEAAGLYPGAPRWENQARLVQSRLLEEPWVKSAQAKWTWDRVEIKIEERKPLGLLPYQGKWVALDETGMILELVDSPAGARLPVLSGVETPKALRGQRIDDAGLGDALFLLTWMGEPLRDQVAGVQVEDDGSLNLFMVAGAQVQWGPVGESKDRVGAITEKLKLFGDLWRSVPRQSMPKCRIDMRVQDRAIPSGCQ